MNIKPSLYHIIEEFKHNADLYGNNPPIKPTITTVRKVMPGAPGRISFSVPQLKPAPKTKYNPADWPEEEDLPIPASKPSSLSNIVIPKMHKKPKK